MNADERVRVRRIALFVVAATLATLGAAFTTRPAAVVMAWLGGFLMGLVTEFRDRP